MFLNKNQQIIAIIVLKNQNIQSSAIHNKILKSGGDISLITVKRVLSDLARAGILIANGSGRSTNYNISTKGRLFLNIDAHEYCSIEPDKRYGSSSYNFDFFSSLPTNIFFENELKILEQATSGYQERTKDLSEAIQKKELERIVIELSWKSSKIEGNTYTLLDTENLLLDNKEAVGKTKQETQMILNHKDAFDFIRKNKDRFKNITKRNLEDLHKILVKNLNVELGLRKKQVGVTGSIYRPLDNIYQVDEAVEALSNAVERLKTPYDKALMVLAGIGYIQPFEDGNKRSGRLMANAILLAYGCAPLSYRSIDENEYREAMLVFYELNSIAPLKKIFIEQYDFAAKNYLVK